MCCFPFLYTISQSLLFPSKKLLPVIRICRIQRCRRVIACHTVLGYEGSDVSIRVFVEQAVVSHAETDYHVQVGMCFVQQTGLQNRVAHGGADTFTLCGDAHRCFGLTGYLADDRVSFEAVGTEDAGKDTGFADEADAVGNADAVRTYFPGKLHDFLHAGPLAVAFVFHFRTGNHNLAVAPLVVTLQCPLAVFLFQVICRTEIRVGAVFVFAVLCAAVHTGRYCSFFHKGVYNWLN